MTARPDESAARPRPSPDGMRGGSSARPRLHVVPWLRGPGARLLPDWLAITVGNHVLAWRALSAAELAHEHEHVRQWRRYGARFAARYVRASWRSWCAGTGWYAGNAFEVAARAAATRARRGGLSGQA